MLKQNKLFVNDDVNADLFGSSFGLDAGISYAPIPSVLNYQVTDNQDESDWFGQNIVTAKIIGSTSSSNSYMDIDDETEALTMVSESNQTTRYLDKSTNTFYTDSSEFTSSENYSENYMNSYLTDTNVRSMFGNDELYSDYHQSGQIIIADENLKIFTNFSTEGTSQISKENPDSFVMNISHSENSGIQTGSISQFDNFFEQIEFKKEKNGNGVAVFDMTLESTSLDFEFFNSNQQAAHAEGVITLVDGDISLDFVSNTISLASAQSEVTSINLENITSSSDLLDAIIQNEGDVPLYFVAAIGQIVDNFVAFNDGAQIEFSDISTIGVNENGDIYAVA